MHGLFIVTTALRSRQEFYSAGTFEPDACDAALLQQYGPHSVALERDCSHVELNQAILANRDPAVVQLLCELLHGAAESGVERAVGNV